MPPFFINDDHTRYSPLESNIDRNKKHLVEQKECREMNFFKKLVPKRIAVFGDWHGNTDWALKAIDRATSTRYGEGVDLLLHVGDFGYWIWNDDTTSKEWEYLEKLEKKLAEKNIELWWVDGNHEYFPGFQNFLTMPDGRKQVREHIYYLPRTYTWDWDGSKWMSLGGAVSVDRKWREKWVDWFPEEQITQTEEMKAKNMGKIDVMITHEAPPNETLRQFLDSNGGKYMFPAEDLEESDNHSRRLGEIVDTIQPTHLYHGHYHRRYDDERTNANGSKTIVHGLDCDTTPWNTPKNYVIVNTAGEIIFDPLEAQKARILKYN